MGFLQDFVLEWKKFVETYGIPREVTYHEALELDPNHISTLADDGQGSRNELPEDDNADYFAFPNPWSGVLGEFYVEQLYWLDCFGCGMESYDDCWLCQGI